MVASGEKNIHPSSTPLHDVMRIIWNDHTGDPCHCDRFCICLMPFVNCGILSPKFRGVSRAVLEAAYAANVEFLVEDTYPTLEGLKQTLDVQALTDPRASKAKAEELVELRFVDELRKSGFVEKLYGRK